jgi:hypothetical protein
VPWNYMQVELVPADNLVRPAIGPGGLSRGEAVAAVQGLLDGGGAALARTAATWRAGAKDDTAFYDVFTWCVYEHPEGEDPRKAAVAWLDDFARIMRSAGADVMVAKLP